ncbi:hypothetical protein NM688_g2738 [Phlebia brevispora]|uniref:Uncharacterized protein n=1 Tax=Phlebia brevispora TaxID=194682 RepID=A0ACC1T7M2_9APHY|nr:hypothetical protein NM688_g2738 [Phlebia brevispora]
MSTTTYRAIVRELNKASIAASSTRNRAILSGFRSLFEQHRTGEELQQFQHDMQDALTFLRSQRMHKVLLDRYNPLHDLTVEERVKATARRVGLDMPVAAKGEDKN